MEFQAQIVDGILKIKPNIVYSTNAQGGTDAVVHALSPQAEVEAKNEILRKLAYGEKIENLEIINNEVKKK